uniref:C2H2-type domain-containing protein n=1 Tax=Parascaris univalens TaxID=6257 RepID=A0A915C3T7_PARUN
IVKIRMNRLAKTVVSRRKQQKPARIIEKMSLNNERINSNSSVVRIDDHHSDQQTEINLRPGTILGPFTICNFPDNDDFSKNTEGNDIVGGLKLCTLNENNAKEPKIIGIATTTATSNANCELFKSDKNLYLRVNRSVQNISDLKANVCSLLYAQQSDVSSNENGSSTVSESLLHLRGDEDVSKPSTSRDVSFVAMAPHAIYLPVAYHDSAVSHMQILGYPQIIIPVAINRTTAHLHTPSLLVDEALSRGLEMPSSLSVGGILLKVDKMPHPASCTAKVIPESTGAFQPLKSKLSIPSRMAMKRHSPSSDNKPLDLSLHIKEKRCAITTKHGSSSTVRLEIHLCLLKKKIPPMRARNDFVVSVAFRSIAKQHYKDIVNIIAIVLQITLRLIANSRKR